MAGGRVALITGAGGFAGSHLINELARETDWELFGLSQHARQHSQTADVGVVMLSCDLLDADRTRRIVEQRRPDVVVHLAAQTYVPRSFASPGATLVNNIMAQVNLLEAIRLHDLDPTILIVGSSEEYGQVQQGDMPITEEQPLRPASPYAVSKVTQDMLGLQYQISYGMQIVRVRPFNHCGPGQSDRFVLANFARQIVEAELGRIEPVIMTGDLSAERDFLDVRDVVRAYRMALESGIPGEVYNIASGRSWRIGDLLERMIALGMVDVEIRQDPTRLRPSDTPRVVGDAARFTRTTGWRPLIPMQATLADIVADWREILRSSP